MNERLTRDGAFVEYAELMMSHALQLAREAADLGEIPIGAVIAREGRIVGKGHNRTEALSDPTAHAEMMAITAATNSIGAKYLNSCTLFVTIEPCLMCYGACLWARIPTIVFGAAEPKFGFTKKIIPPSKSPIQVVSGILEEECATIMRDFFRKKRGK